MGQQLFFLNGKSGRRAADYIKKERPRLGKYNRATKTPWRVKQPQQQQQREKTRAGWIGTSTQTKLRLKERKNSGRLDWDIDTNQIEPKLKKPHTAPPPNQHQPVTTLYHHPTDDEDAKTKRHRHSCRRSPTPR